MKLKRRKSKGRDVWFCEWWEPQSRKHHTKIIGHASGPGALSRKQALQLLSESSMALQAAREALATGALGEHSSMTVAANQWFEASRADWAANTAKQFRAALDCHVLPALGSMTIGELDSPMIAALFQDMAYTRKLSASSVRVVRSVISSMFHWLGMQRVRVPMIPRLPKRMKARVPTAPLTADEIAEVLARRDQLGIAQRIMLLCGLRPGEVLALRHRDVANGGVLVERAVAAGVIGPTKTGRSRWVPLPPELRAELEAMPGEPDALLFSRKGKPYETRWFNRLGTTNPRRFRRTFATLIQVANESDVRDLLGHTDIEMTLRHYRDADAERVARAVADLEQRLRRAG